MDKNLINSVVDMLNKATNIVAFTGAGISAESNIPTFRDPYGIWKKYDPSLLELSYFFEHPKESWKLIKELFIENLKDAQPNDAHKSLAELERIGKLRSVITQNIDNLHQKAGCTNVIEFHGNSQRVECTKCHQFYTIAEINLQDEIPTCLSCGGLLKPDFVFFGENINKKVHNQSILESQMCDLMLVIGTSGEVYPAALIPQNAKFYGATIVEINTNPSNYTDSITDVFLQGKAGKILKELVKIFKEKYF